ncbi:Elongation factor Ts [Trichinella spiralis]|uniref:Elongation factor Ts n=1 Tax=Trichinella spiralis TaxID=6334 RepID=A0ABR3KDG6_TRISP
MRDGVGLGKIYYLLNSVGIDLAVNIALLWPSWLAVGDATAHAEQAESSATTTTITITITISTTNISGCKQTYVVEIEKFDFFRRPAAFGTRTPFAWGQTSGLKWFQATRAWFATTGGPVCCPRRRQCE